MSSRLQKLKGLFLENRSLRQTAFKNTFWLTLSNFGGRIIRAFLLIYIARVLGTAGYGIFSYAVGLAAFFSIFSDLGISAILTREGAKNSPAFSEYIATAFVLKIVLLAITNLILFLGVPFVTKIPEAIPLLPLAALLITFDSLRDFTFSLTRSKEKMQLEAAINITTNLAITAIGIALIYLRPSPKALMLGYTLGSGIGTIVAFVLLRKYFYGIWQNVRPHLAKPILREGFFFGLMGLLGTLMLNTDTVMIGWLSNADALGLYSAAQRPVGLLYMFPGILSTALFPALSRFAVNEKDRFRSLLERAISLSLLFAIPAFLGGLALENGVILLLFGNQYQGAVTSFFLLLSTILITFPGIFIGNAIFAINKQHLFAWFLTLGVLGNAFFNYLLIPRWGIVGSSISTILALSLSNGFSWWKLKQEIHFRTLPYIGKIIFASALMSSIVFGLSKAGLPIILNLIISAPLYFGTLMLLKEPLLDYFLPASLRRKNAVG